MATTARGKAAPEETKATEGAKATEAPIHETIRLEKQYAEGKALRAKVPRESHAEWKAGADRPDPVELLERSSAGRMPELIPIRYGRMMQTPFTFFRGAAAIMARDLSVTPAAGIRVQSCGDCHLVNFGGFATPERRIIFDINDFDETLPAPFEWDVKRLAASFIVAARNNGFKPRQARETALACVASYRKRMAKFAGMRTLKVWYATIDAEAVLASTSDAERRQAVRKRFDSALKKSVPEDDFPKLTELKGGRPVIRDNPPLIFHQQGMEEEGWRERIEHAFQAYRSTLPDDRRVLVDRYQVVDIAVKVVGVGSVGTRCSVMLLMAGQGDSLFLQVKEARESVLEPYAGKSIYDNRGQRVVIGQRLMQSASDIFLGWTQTDVGHFYVRQLKDAKIKPLVETQPPELAKEYGALCGWALARAHAKAGDSARIAGYLGKSAVFDEAIADFAVAYADQNERDHAALKVAVGNGRLKAQTED